jgi:hypothetical protein
VAWTGRVLEPLVVHGEALDEVLVEALDRPLPELGAPVAPHPEAHGDDAGQVVVPEASPDLPLPLLANL